ncbi:nuclear envelope integral membrane protein 1-like isoform X2 [Pomacea canaliculata]|uniref:nuclear envelope integral membrane protein 1-like isoform X2 n=1 Tax=Pomacea canaliculata TaxID=400727 RepID=UPI000D729547|nr:nuclear envelope integral membrane protein 1-like isoform X2 [Pomacea canaliculata]
MARHFLFGTVITLVILTFTSPAKVTLSKDECNPPDYIRLLNETNFKVNECSLTKLIIFCHPGQKKAGWNLWVNPHVLLKGIDNGMPPHDLVVFYGNNMSDVKHRMTAKQYFNWNSFMLLKEEYQLSPFNNSCISFKSSAPYTVHFRIKNPDFWYITYVLLGIIIFFCAPSWSRNSLFHYGTGISFGVLASFLIVFFVLTRLLPQRLKTISYIVMLLSGSASLFMVQLVKNYLFEIIQIHWQLFLSYVGISALVSFIIVYRWGPITETRTLNLVRWILQALGLILIYQGTQIAEASVAIILLVITVYLSPRTVPNWIKFAWYKIFPPKVCLLTEDEYNKEGEEETLKALKELREYCRSPQCNAWNTVGQLSSPSRQCMLKK